MTDARTPEVDALADRGADLFLGRSGRQAPEEGAALMAAAADQGHATAAARVAVLAATGVARRQSWTEALDYLVRAAELGDGTAQRQLAVLADDAELARAAKTAPPQRLARARSRIDVQAWLTPPPPAIACEAPRIVTVKGLAPPAACRWLRSRAKPGLARAMVNDAAVGGQRQNPMRTNTAAHFGLLETDLVLILIQARLAAVSGRRWSTFEAPNILHYDPGEAFLPHYDFFNPAVPSFTAELEVLGQRIATGIVWLNDGYAGGETEFPSLGRRFRGAMGDALIFWNVDELGEPDPRTLHAGLPPTRGQKWVLSQWMRSRVQPIA